MAKIINTESFEKGEAFESFVHNVIFTKDKYDTISKTHNFNQNLKIYIEDSLKPDFKFRCKKSLKEFWVEAKFRSNYNHEDKLDLFGAEQFHRFKEIDQSENLVLVAVGVGGTASNPAALSLIPIENIGFRSPYKSLIKKFEIDIKSINEDALSDFFTDYSKSNKSPDINEKTKEHKNEPTQSIFNKKTFLVAGLILLLISILLFRPVKTKLSEVQTRKIEAKLQENIKSYYKAMESNNVDVMTYYIASNVSSWYTKTDVTLDFIKKDTRKYLKRYPYNNIDVRWNSFKFSVLPNGDFNVSYNMIYRKKSKKNSDYKRYDLNISCIWNSDYKIISMLEERIDKIE